MSKPIRSIALGLWLIVGLICVNDGHGAEPAPKGAVGAIVVEVRGLAVDRGRVLIALVDDPESFGEDDGYLAEVRVVIEGGTCRWIFRDIPYGACAVKVFQDANDNDRLDKLPLFGIPVEEYGFSNNPDTMFGPASFEQARFDLRDSEKVIVVTVH